jgi:Ca2+-binding RTX toxin-like protein
VARAPETSGHPADTSLATRPTDVNTVYGGSGADDIATYEGNATVYGDDTINARDGEVDTLDCGAGADKYVADAFDEVIVNCETSVG